MKKPIMTQKYAVYMPNDILVCREGRFIVGDSRDEVIREIEEIHEKKSAVSIATASLTVLLSLTLIGTIFIPRSAGGQGGSPNKNETIFAAVWSFAMVMGLFAAGRLRSRLPNPFTLFRSSL